MPQYQAPNRRIGRKSGDVLRILSLDGGGFLGLSTAAFIRGIEQFFGVRFCEVFDLFCGTSTGAIIALALASGCSGDQVVELYKRLGSNVFRRRAIPRRGFLRPRYVSQPLREALASEFGSKTLADVSARGKKILVTAFNVTSGQPRVFKTDHSENLRRDGQLALVDVAMASAAAPTYFPLVPVTNPLDGVTEVLCDGGVAANDPALLGYVEALSELHVSPEGIRLLSISTPRMFLGERVRIGRRLNRGLIGWRTSLPSILVDAPSMMSHHVMERIARSYAGRGPTYVRVAFENKHRLALDEATEETARTLEQLGATVAATNEKRKLVQSIISCEETENGRCAEVLRTLP